MAAIGPAHFVLTAKGSEELSLRTHRLDIKLRSLLVLIQKCSPTLEAVLQKSLFPREEAMERLRGLVKEQFVALDSATGGEAPATLNGSRVAAAAVSASLSLEQGISLSQARFGLSDFCLDAFGVEAQPLIDAINAAADVSGLQRVVDELASRAARGGRAELVADLKQRVRDINESRI
jgi:hypothetical protein